MLPTRGEYGELFRLAFPVVVVQLGVMLMGTVDTVMVGHVSPGDLAAVALGNLYFFTVAIFGMGVLLSLDPVISQAVGAEDPDGITRGVQRGALMALGLSVLATVFFLPIRPVLELLRQPSEVIPIARGYALAALPGLVPFYLYIVLRQTLQAMGRVAPIVVTVCVANLANVFFNWVFVYGHLGFDPGGAVGAGWASSLSRLLMVVGIVALAWPILRDHLARPTRTALEKAPLVRMLGLGVPVGFQLQLEWGAFAVVGLIMGILGTLAMASHQVAINLASLTFMVPMGIAQAASVLVGRAVGREDAPGARRAAGAGLSLGAAFMTFTAVMFLALPETLARLYTNDDQVAALAALLLPIAGLFQVFDGIQVVATSVLRGIADTRVPMVLHVTGFWLVGLPVSLWVAFGLDAGPVGLWWGLATGLGVVAVLLLIRVVHRFSRDLGRLILEEGEAVRTVESGLPRVPAAQAGERVSGLP